MAIWAQLGEFFSGGVSKLVDSVGSIVDDLHFSGEEEAKAKELIKRIAVDAQKHADEQRYKMEKLLQEREKQIEETYREEMKQKAGIIEAEMNQSDAYTKRARPSVIYSGIFIAILEILGLRYFVLSKIPFATPEMMIKAISSSTELIQWYLTVWGGVVTTYVIGRSAEKRGIKNKVVQAITRNPILNILEKVSK